MTEKKEVKRKLLVKCIFRNSNRLKFCKLSSPIQNKAFNIGLKIKNTDTKAFPGAKISKLIIDSAENKNLGESFEEDFLIPTLNPDETHIIWVPHKMSTFLNGLVWIKCNIAPKNENEIITTYQENTNTGRVTKWNRVNAWGDAYYILAKYEHEQSKTNKLIFFLTILILLHGIFGIRNIVLWITQLIADFFLSLGGLLSTLAK